MKRIDWSTYKLFIRTNKLLEHQASKESDWKTRKGSNIKVLVKIRQNAAWSTTLKTSEH